MRIPPEIKAKVVVLWTKAMSRDDIAHLLGIGNGSVSRIIDQIKSREVPDIDLLRHIALQIKNEGFELVEVASGIRFSNFIKKMGSSEEEMEKLLKDLEIYCFETEQDFHDFIGIVEKINEFEMDFDISIHQIPDYLEQKRIELYKLHAEILKTEMSLTDKDVSSQT